MANSPSPQMSPVMGVSHRTDRQQSASPPHQQLSKRDKKRTLLSERLNEITTEFSQNRDKHYREQLQALQIDMNLIMGADAHGKEPLRNSPAEIDELVVENIQKTMMKANNPPPRAGKVYADFAKEINDSMEDRDAALVTHRRDFEVKLSELEAAHAFRLKLAQSEHKSLSTTLRDRLINSISNKKSRLSRDKETMEIGESNALLLHPSQFGIANPASPGGLHGKRTTRHRRDPEELPTFGDNNNKRKRKALEEESPAPTRQRIDNGNSTPIWFSEKQALHAAQIDSSVYSIDKLFTEKELAMAYNVAALASHSHMQRHAPYDDVDSPPNGKSDDSSEHEKATAANDNENEDADSPLGGAMMERQYSHATRSTRGVPGALLANLGIDTFNDLNIPANFRALTEQIPKLPPLLAIQKTFAKSDAANQPAALHSDTAALDISLIRNARAYNDKEGYGRNLDAGEQGGRILLETVATPRLYQYYVNRTEDRASYVRASDEREDDDRTGGEMMEKQLSQAASDLGGVAMSRQATGEGQSSRGRRLKHKE